MAQLVSLGLGGSAGMAARDLDDGWVLPAIDGMLGGGRIILERVESHACRGSRPGQDPRERPPDRGARHVEA